MRSMNPCIVARTPTNENIESFLWQPWAAGSRKRSKMLKKSTSIVLASFRGSTYRSVRLASSLTATLLDSLFEHPELLWHQRHSVRFQRCFMYKPSFSAAC